MIFFFIFSTLAAVANASLWGKNTLSTPPVPSKDARRGVYSVAIRDLHELQSAPACHQTAAKLLVNDCDILRGKDESTILTSGVKVRDFVDFFSIGLALCDLDGSVFHAPGQCRKFTENFLAELPLQPTLHVSTGEIGKCLKELSRDSVPWMTYLNYRDKALTFCEVARVDYQKTQYILLHERLARILANLADGVESELGDRVLTVGRHFDEVEKRLGEMLSLFADQAREAQLSQVALVKTAENSASILNKGLEAAQRIHDFLMAITVTAREAQSEMVVVRRQFNWTLEAIDANTRAAVELHGSVAALGTQVEQARRQQLQFSEQQQLLQEDLARLREHATKTLGVFANLFEFTKKGERLVKMWLKPFSWVVAILRSPCNLVIILVAFVLSFIPCCFLIGRLFSFF